MIRRVPLTTYTLPLRPPRQWLPENFDASNATQVQEILLRLGSEVPDDFRSAHRWFGLFQEASSAISELHTRLELALHTDTSDKQAQLNLRLFDENTLSQMLRIRGQLMDIYMSSPWKGAMHADDKGRIAADFKNRRRFARADLIEDQIAENQLVRDYRTFMNDAQTEFQGRNTPVSVVIGRLSDPEAAVRKAAFLSYWDFIERSEEKLQSLFDSLISNRHSQALKCAETSFVPLAFAELGRLDYGPKECSDFRFSLKKTAVPCLERLKKHQLQALGTVSLHPWDAGSWPGLAPHSPPSQGRLSEVLRGFGRISSSIHPAFGKLFQEMLENGLIDVSPRMRKSPGAFCVTFQESRMPFLFGNFSGSFKDAFTLVHEFGHAIHGYATGTISNVLLRLPGLEFCEVASMGLEMLALAHLKEWWPEPEEQARAVAFQLYSNLQFWPFMAMIDEFQHNVYARPQMSASERNQTWVELSRAFRPQIDWSGYERYEKFGWFSRPHVFTSPFYYIDYGIAQLGSLQLWGQTRRDPQGAVINYIKGLSLGAQRSLPELFEAMGLKLDFSTGVLTDLVNELENEILSALQANS
jgi:oligoendopeptidase F